MTTPTADDPALKVAASPVTERGVAALALNAPTVDAIDWGDGSRSPYSGRGVFHTYASAKAYTVTALDGDTIVATAQVFVRDGLTPNVTFAADAGNPNMIIATFNDDPADLISRYEVTWAPGAVEEVVAAKGTTKTHGFQAGDHTIVVRDMHSGRVLSEDITVKDKEYDPDFTLVKGADANTALLEITRLVTAGKELLVDWGDYTQTTITAADAKVGFKVSHPYAAADTYLVQLVYSDGSTEGSARVVTIPFPAARSRR